MAHLEWAERRSEKELEGAGLKRSPRRWGSHAGWWLPPAIGLAALVVWEGLARFEMVSPLFFPAPSTILKTLLRLAADGALAKNLGASLARLLAGFFLGALPGLILGLVMGWSRRVRVVLDPIVAAAHPMPKIALLPLIMLIFGIGEVSKLIAIAVGAFFPMLINSMAGVREISPIYHEVALNYGANRRKILTRVVLPGSLPMVLGGARIALNLALLLAIAVEMVAAQQGLGAMIWNAWQTFRTEELYSSLAVIAALGITFNFLLKRLAVRLAPWHRDRED